MHRKLTLALVLGSYIRGIHQVTMIHILHTMSYCWKPSNAWLFAHAHSWHETFNFHPQ